MVLFTFGIANPRKDFWHYSKDGVDTILLGNCYRLRSTEHDDFGNLYRELAEHFTQVTGVVLVGDLNIHHQRWQHHSREDTHIGADMTTFYACHVLFRFCAATY